ncbi:MAG: nuclease [Tissierellia bacterium]|nr:nuclease [Tissierellia bacterium]
MKRRTYILYLILSLLLTGCSAREVDKNFINTKPHLENVEFIKENNDNTFQEAKVDRVVDGDTIHVEIADEIYKIRMILVDTPETVHPNKPVEWYGKEASDYTKSQLSDTIVYLQKDVSDTDRYGRLLRYVWLERPSSDEPTEEEISTMCFNSLLLENGYAQISTFPPDVKYQEFFQTREQIARENKSGLWGDKSDWDDEPKIEDTSIEPDEVLYIGNKNSKIFHSNSCDSVSKMKESNKVNIENRDFAISNGYKPCNICKP